MTTESFKMFITGPLSALAYTWVTVIPMLLFSAAFAGGAGHLGAWAGVCQRVTDGAELLPANSPSQWQVSAMTTNCNWSISGETQQFWRLNTRMKWLYCCGEKNHMMHLFFCVRSGWAAPTAPPCVETWRRSSPSSRDCVWHWRSVPSTSYAP